VVIGILRTPLVVYGYLVERMRRVPIVGSLLRHSSLVIAGLLVAAIAAFMIWAATVAPQRVGMADLVAGKLSTMQSWIVISGDLSGGELRNGNYRYLLLDPAVSNASMNVLSEVQLATGAATISGSFVGTREPVPVGFSWVGTMYADPVFVPEPGPPWVSMILVAGAVLLAGAGSVSYPMFFSQTPTIREPRAMTIPIMLRRGPLATAGAATPGELLLQPGAPIELRTGGSAPQQLRLHSVHTGAEAGELRLLTSAKPALRIRQASDDLTMSFRSPEERDTAIAALLADAQQWHRHPAPPKYQTAD